MATARYPAVDIGAGLRAMGICPPRLRRVGSAMRPPSSTVEAEGLPSPSADPIEGEAADENSPHEGGGQRQDEPRLRKRVGALRIVHWRPGPALAWKGSEKGVPAAAAAGAL